MASGHFTWLHNLPSQIHSVSEHYPDTEKTIVSVAVALGLVLASSIATKRLRAGKQFRAIVDELGVKGGLPGNAAPDLATEVQSQETIDSQVLVEELAPKSSGSLLYRVFDFFMEAFVSYHDSVLGKHNRKHVPFTGSIFFFLLFANLLGLVPGMAAATTTVWVNVAIALTVFCYFNYWGIKEHGFWNYIKHFGGGTPLWIAWFIFVVEIVSTCMRVLTLNLRLYWNISADHLVLGAFTEMTKLVIPCAFYALGTFVSFMQAFVFATLTMIYILLATQHEEAH